MRIPKETKSMKPVNRLYSDLKIFNAANVFDEEMEVIAEENPEVKDINELCDIIEDEISCWEPETK